MNERIKEYPLKGVKVYELKVFPDERGFFSEAMREDWKDFLENNNIVQANVSYSYPNVVRAWHRHLRGQVDYFLVVKGSMKICALEHDTNKLVEVVLTEKNLQMVRIPGFYWHGTKTVSDTPSLTIYFTSNLYEYKNPDEERRPWNDPTLIPVEINGKKDDPRCNSAYDWYYSPNK